MLFDPFEKRNCRDIRNNLGTFFVKAIQTRQIQLFQTCIKPQLTKDSENHIKDYIQNRMDCLEKILIQMETFEIQPDNLFSIAVILWNHKLFFEFHEWLEKKWLTAEGHYKKALQAMILAAVVYELLLYKRVLPAKKVAAKAVLIFKQQRDRIPVPFDPDLFIRKLTALDPVPPKFNLI